ncbi:hypothetical protein D8Y22_11510 [Salinadaptatus halalkaliphilus]|uniref:Uncharacterized protein n=1 Tax=Salinadaptatus halalkaliphilus TaxID=2419781 RepID=A0A4S3TM91_9EURY|nr:hypothetical protein D8Y22_11510 [Salinadaptatus halalkaliphilus]
MLAIAGCTWTDRSTEDHQSTGEDTAETASADISSSTVVAAPYRPPAGVDVPWIRLEITNEATAPHGRLEVVSTVDSTTEAAVESHQRFVSYVPPETTLRYYVRTNLEFDEFDDVTTDITDATPQIDSTQLEPTVERTNFSAGSSLVSVTGELEVDATELSRLFVVALVYDEEGQFRGTGTDIKTDPNLSAPIEFNADSDGFRTPVGNAQPASYEILAFDGLP